MKYAWIYLVAISFLFSVNCSNEPSKPQLPKEKTGNSVSPKKLRYLTDTVSYEYFDQTAKDHYCDSCGYFRVSYPVFHGLPYLNNKLKKILFAEIGESYHTNSSFKLFFKKFSRTYQTDRDSNSYDQNEIYTDFQIKIQSQDSALLVLQIAKETGGGAHPWHSLQYINWNSRTDRIMQLNDIFIDGYETSLTRIAEKVFRRNEHLSNMYNLNEKYSFENGTFGLSKEYYITSKGIVFFYDWDYIQPRSEGPIELLISYQNVKHLLHGNFPITQYIK